LSMKCPSRVRNTPQLYLSVEGRQQGTFSMPTFQVPIKCPIEVGVGAEAQLCVDPRATGV
jgi:hypothetical protein